MSSEKFIKRVYGCAIIKSLNGNYNADFTKQPRTLPSGIVYATDKALKYTIRHFLYKNYTEEKVLYFTRNKVVSDAGLFVPMSLRELYEHLFGDIEKVTKSNNSPKWMFYYFDGEKVVGILQKIKPTDITKYYKELDDAPDCVEKITNYAKNADERLTLENDGKIKGVEVKQIETPDLFQANSDSNVNEETESDKFYFYVDKDKKINKIEIDEDLFLSIVKELDLQFFGGYNKIKILYNLLNCIDVRLFGATYTGDTNVSIHGPVQINHGVDKFIQTGTNSIYTEQIKSPVRNDKAKGGEAEMTTIGSSSKTMEAHYVHNFSVNPKNLDDHVAIANSLSESVEKEKYPVQEGLSYDDIIKLQEGLRCGATLYDSTSKAGVENELLIWVELNKDSKQVIPNFTELISVSKDESGKTIVDLTRVDELLKQKHIESQIENINIFFNTTYTELNGIEEKKEGKVHFLPIELSELKEDNNE